MATYTNHSQHTHVDPVEDQDPAREGTTPMLVAALALALVALGIWWYAQRDDAGVATPTPVVTTLEPPAAPVATPAASRPATAGDKARTRAPAAIADRAPRPLAGNPSPEYPRSALRAGEEGAVTLRIVVDARGMPADVQVVERSGSRDRDFDRAAIDAARQWRFEPAIRDGKAVPATVQLPVEFRRG